MSVKKYLAGVSRKNPSQHQWENNPNQHHLKKFLVDIGKKIVLVDIIQKNSDRKNLGQRHWKTTYVDIGRKNFGHP